MSQNKIVLMACGSFSPPTYMHLRMFEIARDHIHSLGLGTVIGGIMSPVHDAYGKKELVPAHHRVAMLELCARGWWVKVSPWEARQPAWTRTRISLQHHQDTINGYLEGECPEAPAWLPDDVINVNASDDFIDNMAPPQRRVAVRLLCGADLLESFATPGLWSEEDMEAIVGRHGLVVVMRGDAAPDNFIYENDLLFKYRRNITIIRHEGGGCVSSTALRRLLRRRLSARFLAPEPVLHYCREHALYGPGDRVEYKTQVTTPQHVVKEDRFKNILISIRDKPSVTEDTLIAKKPRRHHYLLPHSHTDYVAPTMDIIPKIAYMETVPASAHCKPGKAVQVVGDGSSRVSDEKVSVEESTHSSLDSYLLTKEELDGDVNKRRVSEGNVDPLVNKETTKKRCSSSTIRKLTGKKPENVKKSKSEVSKLCEKMKNVKLRDKESGRNYKTRSCNDIVRLVLTKHGIHVISDTEAIV